MEKPKYSLNQMFVAAFVVVGSVASLAIAFNYSGNIQLRFGTEGIQLDIDGERESP